MKACLKGVIMEMSGSKPIHPLPHTSNLSLNSWHRTLARNHSTHAHPPSPLPPPHKGSKSGSRSIRSPVPGEANARLNFTLKEHAIHTKPRPEVIAARDEVRGRKEDYSTLWPMSTQRSDYSGTEERGPGQVTPLEPPHTL